MSNEVRFNSHARQIAEVGRHYTAGDLHLHKLSETGDLVGKTGFSWCLSWILGSILKLLGYSVQANHLLEMVPVLLRKMDRSAQGAQPYTAKFIGVSTTDEQRITNRDAYSTYNIYKRLIENKYAVREGDHILPAAVRDTLRSYNRAYELGNSAEIQSLLMEMRVSGSVEGGETRDYSSYKFETAPRSTASIAERARFFAENKRAITSVVGQKDRLEELYELVTSGMTLLDGVDGQSLAELVDVARAYENLVKVETLVGNPVNQLLNAQATWLDGIPVEDDQKTRFHYLVKAARGTVSIFTLLQNKQQLKELQQLVQQGYQLPAGMQEKNLDRLVAIADAYTFEVVELIRRNFNVQDLLKGVIEHPEWLEGVPLNNDKEVRANYFIHEQKSTETHAIVADVLRVKSQLEALKQLVEQGAVLPTGITEETLDRVLAIANAYAFTNEINTCEVGNYHQVLLTNNDVQLVTDSTVRRQLQNGFVAQFERDKMRTTFMVQQANGTPQKQPWEEIASNISPENLDKIIAFCPQTGDTMALGAVGLPFPNLVVCSTGARFGSSYTVANQFNVENVYRWVTFSENYTKVSKDVRFGIFPQNQSGMIEEVPPVAQVKYRMEYDVLSDTVQITFVSSIEFTKDCTPEQREEIAAVCGISA